MEARATVTLAAIGGDGARACAPSALVDGARAAASADVGARPGLLSAAAVPVLPEQCGALVTQGASAKVLFEACPLPAPLTDALADGLVADLDVGEAAFALALATSLQAHGALSPPDGERLVLIFVLSHALARGR